MEKRGTMRKMESLTFFYNTNANKQKFSNQEAWPDLHTEQTFVRAQLQQD